MSNRRGATRESKKSRKVPGRIKEGDSKGKDKFRRSQGGEYSVSVRGELPPDLVERVSLLHAKALLQE